MLTLFRTAFAVIAAVTCCVAGWAALHVLGVQERPRAAGPVDLRAPEIPAPSHKPPLPDLRVAAEASIARPPATRLGAITVRPHGDLAALPLTLEVRSGWSDAPLATRPLDAAAAPIALDKLPYGEHWLVVTAADMAAKHRYLTHTRVSVGPAMATIDLDVRIVTLRVRVVGPSGQPVPRALVLLTRADDPKWLAPLTAEAAPLTDAQGELSFTPIGAGDYQVSVIGGTAPPMRLTLPGPDAITLTLGGSH